MRNATTIKDVLKFTGKDIRTAPVISFFKIRFLKNFGNS